MAQPPRSVTVSELRALPDAELQAQLETLKRELWNQRLKIKDGSLQQNHHIALARRQIARLLTVARERRKTQPAPPQHVGGGQAGAKGS